METKYPYEDLKNVLIKETIESLTQKPIKSTTYERVILLHEADELYSDLPQPLKYGNVYYYLFKHCSLPIKDTDLLLGRIPEKVLTDEEEAIFQSLKDNCARPDWIRDGGHRSFWWDGLIEHGLVGLRSIALNELERRERDGITAKERLDFLRGIILIYDGFLLYLSRYADTADEAGLHEAATVCRELTLHEPRTFREALQLLLIVQLAYCAYAAANPTLALGRIDLMLEKIYENDKAAGRITPDEAKLLILDYYCKHNLMLGRGEHQISASTEESITGWDRNLNYDSPQYMLLTGRRKDGSYLDGELTHLFVEMIEPRFKNPVIEIRYAPNMQRECSVLWKNITDKVRQSASIMIYNEADCISAYIEAGADASDAFDFQHYGCNHSTLPAIECTSEYAGTTPVILFLDILRKWVNDGYEPRTTDELCSAIADVVREFNVQIIDKLASSYERRVTTVNTHLQMTDCFYRYSVPSAASFKDYGSKYICSSIHISSFSSFVDVFTAVDELVIKKKKMTLSHLMKAVDANFEGYPAELALCRGVAKLGCDDDISNDNAKRLMNRFIDDAHAYAGERLSGLTRLAQCDCAVIPRPIVKISTESDNGHLIGQTMGATPDGRLAGIPLSQNSAPALGACTAGITARLCSIASIPFHRIASGAHNLSIQPKIFSGDNGLNNLASVLGGYFDMGGLQLQVTSIDPKQLIEAQKNPDQHRDLMVRVTGYSAVFVDMDKNAQNDIIRREVMSN